MGEDTTKETNECLWNIFYSYFSSSPRFQFHLCIRCFIHVITERLGVSLRVRPLALVFFFVSTEQGAPEGYSLSMSLYFFRSIDTWSLNRTGSSLIWECTRGMVPNQLANLFMQVCRWAKWSGSAQRDARELWGREVTAGYAG